MFLRPIRFSVNLEFKRFLKREIRNKVVERRASKNLALQYFDFYYAPLYENEWNKIRLAMLTGRKYTALVNNYGDWTQTVDTLNKLGALNMFDFAFKQKYKTESVMTRETNELSLLKIPKSLKVFCFDCGNTDEFPEPKCNFEKILNGASVLSAVALNVEKDDYVLDLCASPGGKTLVMLQTLLPKGIFCNDISSSRLEKLKYMLGSYLPPEDLNKLIETSLSKNFHSIINTKNTFDKVLVDVPCTNDRHSLFSMENNIFAKQRESDRNLLPKTQRELLIQGIDLCKIGGSIVYSTCTLSPIQNEGVIKSVLEYYKDNQEFSLELEPLDYLKNNLDYFFSFFKACSIGILVIPEIQKNFGPLYICKLKKVLK